MGNSAFLAKLLGPYLVIIAVGIMVNLKTYQKVMEDFLKNAALIYLGGVFAMIIGLLIVLSHNLWVAGWQVIITIFGWLALIKGIWLFVLPNSVAKVARAYQKKSALLMVQMVAILILGLLLTYIGYFAA